MLERTIGVGSLTLDNGALLHDVQQRVTIYGDPQNARTVLVTHALTGSSRVAEWWPAIAGERGLFDPKQWRVIGINALGSCYGSTQTATVTIRDMVRAQRRALDELGIGQLDVVIGGSMGGMQALQWALDDPQRVQRAIVIGAHDHFSAMGIALNAVQRECIELDPVRGLRTARKLAMLTYKSEELFTARHGRRADRRDPSRFDVEGYLDLQADRFTGRMDAQTYRALTGAMDGFDVRDRRAPRRNLTFVGISSDWLFRAVDVRTAAAAFGASYVELETEHGHDAFLAEADRVAALLAETRALAPASKGT